MSELYDCIIIGGGVAGLTAGIYLARFNCNVLIIDNHSSRASLISKSYNFPAFPSGISGKTLLMRLKKQYRQYEHPLITNTVKGITKIKNNTIFAVKLRRSTIQAKFVILATGVIDLEPEIPNLRSAIKNKIIRHCLICDGYEAQGKKIVILGDHKSCLKQALALSCYSKHITILAVKNQVTFTSLEKNSLRENHIQLIDAANCRGIVRNKKLKFIRTKDGDLYFDVVYSALGVIVRSQLAIEMGAKCDKKKSLIVNHCQETSVKRLYAAGDVVKGNNQLCTAMSQGATAAIDIFHKLNK